MLKKNKKVLEDIKKKMIDALEEPTTEIVKGKKHIYLTGEYVCHEDMIETPEGYCASFVVAKDMDLSTYLVLFLEVDNKSRKEFIKNNK